MFGPGEYRPDPSAGITAPADLPQPEVVSYSRNDLRQPCPRCGHAVVGAVASARKVLAATQPKLPQGRPSTPAAKAAARTKKRLTAQGAALCAARHLFVQRHLTTTERKTLWRVSRGLPQFQALRAIMEQVSALFDRRYRTQTALDTLAKLRRRVQRFTALRATLKKLFAPTLDKALTFLDDKLLPSTAIDLECGGAGQPALS